MKKQSYINTPKGPFRYWKKFLFVGVKKIDRAVAFENLKELAVLLDRFGIQSGLVFGTLLGIIRENDFIEWDEDIDMYILKEQEDLFRSSLWDFRDAGFELVRYDRRGLYSLMKDGEYIDFYVMRKASENVRTTGASFMFEKYIRDTVAYDFKGITLQIPRDYEEYLEFAYGDWRTPRQYADFNMGKARIWLLKAQDTIKGCLPDALYSALLRLHHRKDLKAFVAKCVSKGIPVDEGIHL